MTTDRSPVQIAQKSESPFCQVHLVLTIDPEFSQQERKKAMRKIAGEIALPGFRKGKVPLTYLQKHYHNQIDSSWSQQLAEAAIDIALKQTSPAPFAQNQRVEFTWESLELNALSRLSARYEAEPSPPDQIDWKALTIEPPKQTPLPQAVESALADESEKQSVFDRVSGPSRAGHYIDFEIRAENAPEQILLMRKKCPLQRDQLPDWAFDLLIDLQTGEERSGSALIAEKEPLVACLARIDQITCRKSPLIDDELAQKLGFDNLQLWRAALTDRLSKQSDEQFRISAHQLLVEAAVKANRFEVPKSALDREMESLQKKGQIKRFKDDGELQERALATLRQFFLLSHWSQTRGDLAVKEQIDSIVFGQLRHLDANTPKEMLQRQLAFLYHNARLSQIASRVLDEAMEQLKWKSGMKNLIPND